ncbi:MAG: ABC transporter ATP-binding protein [Gammaproteobacteria bacterium]|nr:ABC transporter ATP-binding protein [Gammaproteobacteria bacterium]
MSNEVVLELRQLCKVFEPDTPRALQVLFDIDLQLYAGELTALVGPSGSGKSTLLNLMGLLDTPSKGELLIQGQATAALDDTRRTALRAHHIGFVFQFHHLIGAFNVLDNVLMPLMLQQGKPNQEQLEYAHYLLEAVGLADLAQRSAKALSGGQQQRVAIARALVNRPALLLADEPTGNLDTQTADEVFTLFEQFNRETGCATLIVTHDPLLSARCPRTISMLDGRIAS